MRYCVVVISDLQSLHLNSLNKSAMYVATTDWQIPNVRKYFSGPFGLDSVRHHRWYDRGDNDVHHDN